MTTLRTLESFSQHYVSKMLSRVSSDRLANDPYYATRVFFHYWAFERAGAPKAFRVAAVKTIAEINRNGLHQHSHAQVFRQFLSGNVNRMNNPFLDPCLNDFDVTQVIEQVREGNLSHAFDMLALNGINHKIRSFFIRDIIQSFDEEGVIQGNCSNAIFAFPIDTWVRVVLSTRSVQFNRQLNCDAQRRDYGGLQSKDFKLASAAILACFDQRVSPIKLNMGIWYFASQCVGDGTRLRQVLTNGDQAVVQEASPFVDLL